MSDQSKHQCEFCNTQLQSKYSLSRHQKTSKKCIAIQKENNISVTIKEFICSDCDFKAYRTDKIQEHMRTCKKRLIAVSNEYDKMKYKLEVYEKLCEEYKKEAFKPKNITNNTNNNTNIFNMQLEYSKQVLSPYEDIKKDFRKIIYTHLSRPVFNRGIPGICSLINKILNHDDKKWLLSYDNSKTTFHKNLNNEITIDEKAEMFISDIFPYIKEVAKDIYKENPGNTDSEEDTNMKTWCSILRIGEIGSEERMKCVNSITNAYCMSNNNLRIMVDKAKNQAKYITNSKDNDIYDDSDSS